MKGPLLDLQVPALLGGGIGAIPENKDVMHLTNHAYQLFKFLKKEIRNELGINLTLNETDVFSTTGRKKIIDDRISSGSSESPFKTWADFSDEHLESSKLFVKFPGATLKNRQIITDVLGGEWNSDDDPTDKEVLDLIESYYEVTFEQAESIHGFLRTSPNAWLRLRLNQTTIYRPFPEIKNGYKPIEFIEGQETLLDVVGWDEDISNDFYKELENGKVGRELSFEQIDQYCEKVVNFAKTSGKKIVIPTKSTITKFENTFLVQLKTHLNKNNIEYRECLTDAFLEGIAHNKYPSNEYLVASVPNVTISLEKIQNVKNSDIYRESNTAPARHFYRGATGDGYAEEKWEENGSLFETNTLDENVSRQSILDAYKKAQELDDILTLVIDDTNNPNNSTATRYAEEISGGEFKVMTLGEYMQISLTNPTSLGKVFVGSNVIGDYISDFNAGIACSNLKPGTSLGIAPSVDSNGTVREANPAAGTAPMLANKVEESKGILPASILLSITLAIKDILVENPEYAAIDGLIDNLEKQIISTVEEYIENEETDYSQFTLRMIKKVKKSMEKPIEKSMA